jgi:ABC-2 type transport system permease protein
MSALGGSMVPRFVMPKFMETTALFTFNGWALDGFLKVFWYAAPGATALHTVASLISQLSVLTMLTVIFIAAARLLARRWETV